MKQKLNKTESMKRNIKTAPQIKHKINKTAQIKHTNSKTTPMVQTEQNSAIKQYIISDGQSSINETKQQKISMKYK